MGRITPRLFKQEVKDPSKDGELVGDYKDPTFPDTNQYYTPSWDAIKHQWSWGADEKTLTEIISRCRLKQYLGKERNFAKYGDYIEPGNVASRLKDILDPFFTHPTLWKTARFEGGRVNFDLNNPIHTTVYHIARGDRRVNEKSNSGVVSKYTKGGWIYDLVESDVEVRRKVEEAEKDIDAIEVLITIRHDIEKLHKIALIMGLPGYTANLSDQALFLLVKDSAAENNAKHSKFDGKTYQEVFVELAKSEDFVLDIMHKIMLGLRRGRIRQDGRKGYIMNGKSLTGVRNEAMLIDYFMNDDNVEDYLDLTNFLEAFEKRKKTN